MKFKGKHAISALSLMVMTSFTAQAQAQEIETHLGYKSVSLDIDALDKDSLRLNGAVAGVTFTTESDFFYGFEYFQVSGSIDETSEVYDDSELTASSDGRLVALWNLDAVSYIDNDFDQAELFIGRTFEFGDASEFSLRASYLFGSLDGTFGSSFISEVEFTDPDFWSGSDFTEQDLAEYLKDDAYWFDYEQSEEVEFSGPALELTYRYLVTEDLSAFVGYKFESITMKLAGSSSDSESDVHKSYSVGANYRITEQFGAFAHFQSYDDEDRYGAGLAYYF